MAMTTPQQFLGLVYAGLLGGFSCNLAGIYIAEHTPFISNVGQMAEAGGVRLSQCVACCGMVMSRVSID